MWFWGELVLHHRQGSRRFYDLANRHIPAALFDAPDSYDTDESCIRALTLRRINAVGLMWNRPGDAWLGLPGFKTAERVATFGALEAEGRILPLHVAGIPHPLYIDRENLPLLEAAITGAAKVARILAPLDNLLCGTESLYQPCLALIINGRCIPPLSSGHMAIMCCR